MTVHSAKKCPLGLEGASEVRMPGVGAQLGGGGHTVTSGSPDCSPWTVDDCNTHAPMQCRMHQVIVLTFLAYFDKGLNPEQLEGALLFLDKMGRNAQLHVYDDCWFKSLSEAGYHTPSGIMDPGDLACIDSYRCGWCTQRLFLLLYERG
jgi:hypothetical protein